MYLGQPPFQSLTAYKVAANLAANRAPPKTKGGKSFSHHKMVKKEGAAHKAEGRAKKAGTLATRL